MSNALNLTCSHKGNAWKEIKTWLLRKNAEKEGFFFSTVK